MSSDYPRSTDLSGFTSRLQNTMIRELRHTDDNLSNPADDANRGTYENRYSRTTNIGGSGNDGLSSYSRTTKIGGSGNDDLSSYSRTTNIGGSGNDGLSSYSRTTNIGGSGDGGLSYSRTNTNSGGPADGGSYQSRYSRTANIGGSRESSGLSGYTRTTDTGGFGDGGLSYSSSTSSPAERYQSSYSSYSSSRGDSGLDGGITSTPRPSEYNSTSTRSTRLIDASPIGATTNFTTVQVGGAPPIFNPYRSSEIRDMRRVDFNTPEPKYRSVYENGGLDRRGLLSSERNGHANDPSAVNTNERRRLWNYEKTTSSPIKVSTTNSTPERKNNRGDMAEYVRFVTITANVQSIVANPETLKEWAEEMGKEIGDQKPSFAAIHLQGLGTKNSKTPPIAFYNALVENEKISKVLSFSKAYLDAENGSEHTGLGSIFFIQNDEESQIWNNSNKNFSPIRGTSPNECIDNLSRCNAVFIKGIFPKDTVPDKLQDKSKQQDELPNAYLVFKWKLFDKVFTFVNLNLFATPFIPLQDVKQIQSSAALARQDQIQYILQKLQEDDATEGRYWAGAFNTELDLDPLLDDLSHLHRAVGINKEDESGKLEAVNYFDIDGQRLMSACEDKFDLFGKHDWFFGLGRGCMARKYNREIEKNTLKGLLHEHNTYFPPTCHFDYDKREDRDTLNRNRLPSWADRIFYNQAAMQMMKFDSFSSTGLYYGIVGANKNIGRHKPVALHATVCLKERKFG